MSIVKKFAQATIMAIGGLITAVVAAVKGGAMIATAVGVTATLPVVAIKAATFVAAVVVVRVVNTMITRYTGFGDVLTTMVELQAEHANMFKSGAQEAQEVQVATAAAV